MTKIRVLVVDDHTILRDGLCALLTATGDIEVVGEAANGRDALNMIGELQPDIVLMDIHMPIMSGLEATRFIRNEYPLVKVIALTQYEDKEYVFPMIEAGAQGFISKTSASSELGSGIRSVYQGDSYLSPAIAKLLVEDRQLGNTTSNKGNSYHQLTNREKEILKLTAEGHTVREIADKLIISPKTVEGHKTNMMSKLNLHSTAELIKYALRNGIITV